MSFLDVLLSFATGTVRTQAVDSGGSVVAIAGNLVLATTSTSGVSVAPPPAPVRGSLFGVADDSATSATHAITVAGAGGLFAIESPATPGTYATSVTIATNSQVVWWLYTGAAWKIVSIDTTSGGGGGAPTGPAGGDLHGTYPNPGVGALWGVAVSSTAPSPGQVLTDTGGVWTPATPSSAPTGAAGGSLAGTYPNPSLDATGVVASTYGDSTHVGAFMVGADGRIIAAAPIAIPTSFPPSGSAGGDLGGSYPNPSVAKIQGVAVSTTAPSSGQVLTDVGGVWTPAASGGGPPTGAAGGDLSGSYPNPAVAKLQGVAVSTTAPSSGQVLTDVGGTWTPATPSTAPTGTAGGDLGGTYPNPSVVKLQGVAVSSTAPSSGQVLTDVGGVWTPAASGGGPPTGTAGGDLSGSYPNPSVVKLQGVAISSTAPSAGQVLTDVGGVWTPAATGSPSAWTTLVDLDFTAQTTQTLGTDTTFTIGGLVFTKVNSANDNVAMVVTNGVGLVITPKSTSDMLGTSGTTTAPLLWISFASLGLTAFSWETRFKVFLSIGADNNALNTDGCGAGLSTLPVSGVGVKLLFAMLRGHAGVTSTFDLFNTINGTTVAHIGVTGVDKTLILGLDRLASFWPEGYFAAALAAGASFPNENTFKPAGRLNTVVLDVSGAPGVAGGTGVVATDMGLLLWGQRSGSATAYVTTIQRVRVDYRG